MLQTTYKELALGKTQIVFHFQKSQMSIEDQLHSDILRPLEPTKSSREFASSSIKIADRQLT